MIEVTSYHMVMACIEPDQVALMGNDAPQFDDGGIAGYPGGCPWGVVNLAPFQDGGESRV